jgi:hypothetical protein
MELMATRGYNLHMDNWNAPPSLFEKLLGADMNAVGTIRLNRKNMPEKLKKQKLEKGDAIAMYSQKIMAVKWQDEETSYHSDNDPWQHWHGGHGKDKQENMGTSQETKACA